MTKSLNSNFNFNDTSIVSSPILVNNATAVKILDAQTDIVNFNSFIEFNILPSNANVSMFIRPYPAVQDNDRRGVWIGRFNMGNDTFFRSFWRMPETSLYTGEWSAILAPGNLPENVYASAW